MYILYITEHDPHVPGINLSYGQRDSNEDRLCVYLRAGQRRGVEGYMDGEKLPRISRCFVDRRCFVAVIFVPDPA